MGGQPREHLASSYCHEPTDQPSPATRRTQESLGWHTGRAVDTSGWAFELAADGFPVPHPVAVQFLTEFGACPLLTAETGITRAREPFTLVPTACLGEADRFVALSEHAGATLPLSATWQAEPVPAPSLASTSRTGLPRDQ